MGNDVPIIADIVDDTDQKGLWIQPRREDPNLHHRVLIPWDVIISILYTPDQQDRDEWRKFLENLAVPQKAN